MMSRFLFFPMRNRIRLRLRPTSAGEIRVASRVNQTRHPFESPTRTNQPDFFEDQINRTDRTNMSYASMISTIGLTADLGISAGQYATISSTFGLPPPSPQTVGGPFKPKGANSFTNRSSVA